jgi:parvulin-like peptidyl-prolyl isomerase
MPKKQQNSKNERPGYMHQQPEKQRKKRARNIVISLVIIIVIAAISIGGWYYYDSQIKPYNQAAIRVNDVTFSLRYFINTLKIYYGNISPDYLTDYTDYGDSEIEQFAAYVAQQIVRNETVKQGSLELGVQIERDVIKADLKELDMPVTDEHIDILMAQELVEKQVPSTQPQVHVQAMLLESESVAQEAIARLQTDESFEQVANDLSKIPADYGIVDGDLGWVTAREADLTVYSTEFGDMISGADVNVLSDPLYDDTVTKMFGYWVIKVVEKTDATDTSSATINIQGILVGSEQEAYDVINKLNAGADMDELAKQLSELSGAADNGAELGWITESEDNGGFDVLFDLPLNEISAPISDNQYETKGGFWVFNVLEENDNRELTADQQNLLMNDLLERCSDKLQKDPDYNVEILITQEMRDLALNKVVLAQGEGSVIIGAGSLPDAEVGLSYSFQLEVYGHKQDNTWSITEGSLPKGLSLDTSTGFISGVPEYAGVSSLTIEVSNKLHYNQLDFVMRVHISVSITTSSLPDAQVGVYYSEVLEVFADTDDYTWSIISGTLPDGLTLSQYTGYIYGTPTTDGTYDFTIQVDDGLGTATQTLSLIVQIAQ